MHRTVTVATCQRSRCYQNNDLNENSRLLHVSSTILCVVIDNQAVSLGYPAIKVRMEGAR